LTFASLFLVLIPLSLSLPPEKHSDLSRECLSFPRVSQSDAKRVPPFPHSFSDIVDGSVFTLLETIFSEGSTPSFYTFIGNHPLSLFPSWSISPLGSFDFTPLFTLPMCVRLPFSLIPIQFLSPSFLLTSFLKDFVLLSRPPFGTEWAISLYPAPLGFRLMVRLFQSSEVMLLSVVHPFF